MPSSLRNWLKRQPEPDSLRIRTQDDEERPIKLEPGRYRWRSAEEAILNARAVVVECLSSSGEVLRSRKLEYEGDVEITDEQATEKAIAKAVHAKSAEMAHVLDRFGDRLNQAFDRGAAAANTGQENLVSLVEVLTSHLSLAITNLHNVSVNLANMVQQAAGGEEPDRNGQMLSQLMTAVAAKALAPGGEAKPPAAPNGKKAG